MSTMPQAPTESSAGEVEALRQQIAALQVRGGAAAEAPLVKQPCMVSHMTNARSQATLQQKEQQQPSQQPAPPLVAPYSRSYGRTHVARILAAADGGLSLVSTAAPLLLHPSGPTTAGRPPTSCWRGPAAT